MKVLGQIRQNTPNQRYESWSMPHAHVPLGIPRVVFSIR